MSIAYTYVPAPVPPDPLEIISAVVAHDDMVTFGTLSANSGLIVTALESVKHPVSKSVILTIYVPGPILRFEKSPSLFVSTEPLIVVE